MEPQSSQNQLTIPVAIIIAGCIIALGIMWSGKNGNSDNLVAAPLAETQAIEPRPVDANDYILGNPNAKVTFIEYSDTECPICKTFHPTMKQLVEAYGKSGDFAWVYRQFPIRELHPKAPKESEALLCAGDLGGNQTFWDYLNDIFAVTPSNNLLDHNKLYEIAVQNGLDDKAFRTCLDSGKFTEAVEKDYQDGLSAGVRGTPHTVIVTKATISEKVKKEISIIFERYRDPRDGRSAVVFGEDKKHIAISGKLPYDIFKKTVDVLLTLK